MKKFLKGLKLGLINLTISFLILETAAVLIFFIKTGSFFYSSHQRVNEEQLTVREKMKFTEGEHLTSKRLHPFFGYTYQWRNAKNLPPTESKAEIKKTNTNNYGFICAHDYPLKRDNKNWFIIGIFGGSVAEDFYLSGGCRRLEEQLIKDEAYARKEFVFLNFAVGGYKQPQQLQILTYFLAIGQQFDMVINIDGFNEVAFCFNNNRLNVDIAMPSAQHFLPLKDLTDSGTLTDEKLDIMWRIRDIKRTFLRNRERINQTPFATVHLIYSAYNKYLYKKYRENLIRFDNMTDAASTDINKNSLVNIKYTAALENKMQLLTDTASLWYRASYIMHGAVASRGGRYVHFLQPNQYFSKKAFSEAELNTAIAQNSPYKQLVSQGYPALQQALSILKKKNIRAYDAASIFDHINEDIYTDDCCHFNTGGHEIFADFMAACILERN